MTRLTIKQKIVKVLERSEEVSADDIARAERLKKQKGIRFIDALTQLHLVDEKKLLNLLAEECHIPFMDLIEHKVDKELAYILAEKTARKYTVLPVAKSEGKITVVLPDPFNLIAIDDIKMLVQMDVDLRLGSEREILRLIDELYRHEMNVSEIAEESGEETLVEISSDPSQDYHEVSGGKTEHKTDAAPIVRIVDLILIESFKKGASDIHIEPFEHSVRVRYRIDGLLREALTLPKSNLSSLVARIKILANLDITENRIPQDGRFKMRFATSEVDYRISVLPVYWGAKIVMRILDKSSLRLGLESIGFAEKALKDFRDAVDKPFGMIVITGPTGSGKSTTLYSILWEMNTPERNIITLEDPIEYQITGITQVQARPEIGLTFANGLRSILRQSPDVVMLGEIRDKETGDIAVKASLTGQLVLTTLHTNDAVGAISRLEDMGVEPFLLSSSLNIIAAQRLCRKICQSCKTKVDVPSSVLSDLGIDLNTKSTKVDFYKGAGCDKCENTGYRGRIAVAETILVDEGLRKLIEERKSSQEIRTYVIKHGMQTLRQDAIEKFKNGLITSEEVYRVTQEG